LSEERDFGSSLGGESFDLAGDVLQFAAPLRSARHRNDAQRAPIIATTLNRSELRGTWCPDGRYVFVMFPAAEIGVHNPLTAPGFTHQGWQIAIGVGAGDEVDLSPPLEQRGTQPLRHAAHHADDAAGRAIALQLAHATN